MIYLSVNTIGRRVCMAHVIYHSMDPIGGRVYGTYDLP